MVKRGKNQKQQHWKSMNSKLKKDEDIDINDMDDEIDAFHKKRDMIPLDVDADSGDSDDDDEQPVFNYKGIEDDDEDGESEGDDEKEYHDSGLAKKIVKQQEYFRKNTVNDEDELLDNAEEDKERTVWSKGKQIYYGNDDDFELQSSDEDMLDEEEEVIRLQAERAKSMTAEDYGLQMDDDVSDGEPTLGEMVKGKTKSSADKEADGDGLPMYEKVKKDLDALSKDEQMDAVYRSAPELSGLLAELNIAFNRLETEVNPLLAMVQKVENAKKEGKNYFEVKQLLLHAYCQAIVFYLLLKSEGQPVRDHPVIARIVEIKSLLDKMKELDHFIPDGLEEALNKKCDASATERPGAKYPAELNGLIGGTLEKKDTSQETAESLKMQLSKSNEKKRKVQQEKPVSSESVKMLQHRAALEEKLRQKTVSGLDASKTEGSKKKLQKTATGKLETTYDYDDDVAQMNGATHDNGTLSSKLSRIIPAKKKKGVSGDDDLPERDDLGQRRWKHELRVLSRVGVNSNDDGVQLENEVGHESLSDGRDDVEDGDGGGVDGSDDDFYTTIKRQRDLKLKMKAEKFSRNPQDVPEPEITVDGKRIISAPMEKNRGLTRNRKKQNPRVNQKKKFEKATKRRKGQVREMRKPTGPYSWEPTGINPRVTKSIKFK